ncbi:hypothetical protein LGZ99_24315, partial [Photorhabdus temperata]|nr:hypothetical protein [Photorhabdus temperata]
TVEQAKNAYPKTGGQITGKVYADDDIEAKGWIGATKLYDHFDHGGWSRAYSEAFPPSAAVVGAYSRDESNTKFAYKTSQETFTCGNLHVDATHDWSGIEFKKPSGYNTTLNSNPDNSENMLTIRYRDKKDDTMHYVDIRKKSGTMALVEQLLGVGQKWTDVISNRRNKTTYTNSSDKPIIVYIESNRTGASSPFSIDITVSGLRVAYRWISVDEIVSLCAIVPPGATYRVNGGWGQPSEWVVINNWIELR